jgi:hypothetical protein
VWCDNKTELLAVTLRPGNARANTAADHIDVLTQAITQIPATHRCKLLAGEPVTTTDSAGPQADRTGQHERGAVTPRGRHDRTQAAPTRPEITFEL